MFGRESGVLGSCEVVVILSNVEVSGEKVRREARERQREVREGKSDCSDIFPCFTNWSTYEV